MKKILDASVVVKWFTDEAGSEVAQQYLHDFLEGKYTIIFPALLFYELGNVLVTKNIPVKEVGDIMQILQRYPFQIEDIGLSTFRKIYQNAKDYALSFYDASYVTLMQKHSCELVTADKKLYNNVKGKFAKIKLLKG